MRLKVEVMKRIKNIFVLMVLLITAGNAYAQFELNYFFANQFNNKVELSWEVKQGSTCNGMQIERSTDSVNYSFIGEIPGVCGSTASAQKFQFTDISPMPFQKNYYRIIAGTGERFYKSVFFSYVKESFVMVPNPVRITDMVYFEPNQTFIVTFYQLTGQIIQTSTVSQSAIPLAEILTELPNSPFLLHVEAKNGNHETKKLIGIR
jgi:hypothetical protein